MVVASFLVKHLLLSWQDGARWFWDTLVDADLASNTQGWQWLQVMELTQLHISGYLTPLLREKNLTGKVNTPVSGFPA